MEGENLNTGPLTGEVIDPTPEAPETIEGTFREISTVDVVGDDLVDSKAKATVAPEKTVSQSTGGLEDIRAELEQSGVAISTDEGSAFGVAEEIDKKYPRAPRPQSVAEISTLLDQQKILDQDKQKRFHRVPTREERAQARAARGTISDRIARFTKFFRK